MREQPWMRHVTHQITTLILGHKDACKSRLVLNLSQAKRIECAVRAVIKLCCTDVSCEWVTPAILAGKGWRGRGESDSQVTCHLNVLRALAYIDRDMSHTPRPHRHHQ